MFGVGTTELLILLVIIILIFGSTKLPQLGAGIGQGIKNFKKAMKEPDAIDVSPDKKAEKTESKDEKKQG